MNALRAVAITFFFHDMVREASEKHAKELRSIRVEAGRRASQLPAPRRKLPARGYFFAPRRPTFEELLANLSPWELLVNNAEYVSQKNAIDPRDGDDADADLTKGNQLRLAVLSLISSCGAVTAQRIFVEMP